MIKPHEYAEHEAGKLTDSYHKEFVPEALPQTKRYTVHEQKPSEKVSSEIYRDIQSELSEIRNQLNRERKRRSEAEVELHEYKSDLVKAKSSIETLQRVVESKAPSPRKEAIRRRLAEEEAEGRPPPRQSRQSETDTDASESLPKHIRDRRNVIGMLNEIQRKLNLPDSNKTVDAQVAELIIRIHTMEKVQIALEDTLECTEREYKRIRDDYTSQSNTLRRCEELLRMAEREYGRLCEDLACQSTEYSRCQNAFLFEKGKCQQLEDEVLLMNDEIARLQRRIDEERHNCREAESYRDKAEAALRKLTEEIDSRVRAAEQSQRETRLTVEESLSKERQRCSLLEREVQSLGARLSEIDKLQHHNSPAPQMFAPRPGPGLYTPQSSNRAPEYQKGFRQETVPANLEVIWDKLREIQADVCRVSSHSQVMDLQGKVDSILDTMANMTLPQTDDRFDNARAPSPIFRHSYSSSRGEGPREIDRGTPRRAEDTPQGDGYARDARRAPRKEQDEVYRRTTRTYDEQKRDAERPFASHVAQRIMSDRQSTKDALHWRQEERGYPAVFPL